MRSIYFIIIVGVLSDNVTALDFIFVAIELIFFNLLFWNISSIFSVFKLDFYIENQMKYFQLSFVDNLEKSNAYEGKSLPGPQEMAI